MESKSSQTFAPWKYEDFRNPLNNLDAQKVDTSTVFIVESDQGGSKGDPHQNLWSKLFTVSRRGEYIQYDSEGNLFNRQSGVFDQPVNSYFVSDSTAIYNKAVSRFYEKLQGGLNLGVDIAEFAQTRRMVGAAIPKLHTGADLAHAYLTKPTKAAANAYLQWTYGWKPLMSSLFGAIDQSLKRRSFTITATATGQSSGSKRVTSPLDTDFKDDYVLWQSERWRIEALYWSPDLLALINGFTTLSPVSLAYEKMAFSFVLDWAWNIGGYLQNMENAIATNSQFRKGYQTYTRKSTSTLTSKGSVPFAGRQYVMNITGGFRVDIQKERRVLDGGPVPKIPPFKVQLGASRLLSAVALIRQRFGAAPGLPQAYPR